jgi:hypothetical protein
MRITDLINIINYFLWIYGYIIYKPFIANSLDVSSGLDTSGHTGHKTKKTGAAAGYGFQVLPNKQDVVLLPYCPVPDGGPGRRVVASYESWRAAAGGAPRPVGWLPGAGRWPGPPGCCFLRVLACRRCRRSSACSPVWHHPQPGPCRPGGHPRLGTSALGVSRRAAGSCCSPTTGSAPLAGLSIPPAVTSR